MNIDDFKPLQGGGDNGGSPGFFARDNATSKLFDFNDNEEDEDPQDDPSDDSQGGGSDNPDNDGNGGGDSSGGGASDPGDDNDDPNPSKDKGKGLSFDDIDLDEEEEDGEGDEGGEENDEPSRKDKSKSRKEPLVKVFQKLIDDEILLPFDEDKDLADYTQADLQELITTNFEQRREDMRSEVTNEIFENLPRELQSAMNYVANGGKDLKGLFQQLSTTVEVSSLNPEKDAEEIARMYLRETNFGDSDLITEQIQEWREAGTLGKRAKSFHPKLVKSAQAKNESEVERVKREKEERERLGAEFQDSMIDTLSKKDLNGIPLTKELRRSLAEGILTSSHESKFAKTRTNELFHLIEKYQTEEKKPDLIAEALFLLRDPESYRKAVSQIAVRDTDKDRVRKLKTSAERRSAGAGSEEEEERETKRTRKTVKRRGPNFFQR